MADTIIQIAHANNGHGKCAQTKRSENSHSLYCSWSPVFQLGVGTLYTEIRNITNVQMIPTWSSKGHATLLNPLVLPQPIRQHWVRVLAPHISTCIIIKYQHNILCNVLTLHYYSGAVSLTVCLCVCVCVRFCHWYMFRSELVALLYVVCYTRSTCI